MEHHIFLEKYLFCISYSPISTKNLNELLLFMEKELNKKQIIYKKFMRDITKEETDLFFEFNYHIYHKLNYINYIFHNKTFKIVINVNMLYVEFDKNIDFNMMQKLIRSIFRFLLKSLFIKLENIYIKDENCVLLQNKKTIQQFTNQQIDLKHFSKLVNEFTNYYDFDNRHIFKTIIDEVQYSGDRCFKLELINQIFIPINYRILIKPLSTSQINTCLKQLKISDEQCKISFDNFFEKLNEEQIIDENGIKMIGGKK